MGKRGEETPRPRAGHVMLPHAGVSPSQPHPWPPIAHKRTAPQRPALVAQKGWQVPPQGTPAHSHTHPAAPEQQVQRAQASKERCRALYLAASSKARHSHTSTYPGTRGRFSSATQQSGRANERKQPGGAPRPFVRRPLARRLARGAYRCETECWAGSGPNRGAGARLPVAPPLSAHASQSGAPALLLLLRSATAASPPACTWNSSIRCLPAHKQTSRRRCRCCRAEQEQEGCRWLMWLRLWRRPVPAGSRTTKCWTF